MDIKQLRKEVDCDKDYYGVLELEPGAYEPVIKNAYKKLSLLWHPDKWSADKVFPPDNTTLPLEKVKTHFNEIRDAYEVLISFEKRRFYNAVLSGDLLIKPSPVPESERRINAELSDYYACLGLPNSWVSLIDIIRAHRRLSAIWNPDRWSKDTRYAADVKEVVNLPEGTKWCYWSVDNKRVYPDNAIALTHKAVKARAAEFKEANEILSCVLKRERYDRARYKQPQNEAEFLAWLKEDAKKYPRNICFRLATQYPSKLNNIWRLIESQRLNYGAFEGEQLRNIFWDVIFSDDALTDYVCTEWQCGEAFRLGTCGVSYNFIQFVDFDSDAVKMFEKNWQCATDSHEPLAENVRLLIAVLSKSKQIRYRKGVELYFITLKRQNSDECFIRQSLVALGSQWVIESIHAYWKKECSFDVLLQHLRFLSEIVFKDCTSSLRTIDRYITQPMQAKLQTLDKRSDKISQEKVAQLNAVLKEVQQTVQEEFRSWVESNFKQPHQDPCYDVLRTDFNKKTVELQKKILSVITDYAEKKEIGKNANQIGAFLKWLAYAALCAFTGGVAALVSQRVRDGLCFRPDTQVKLRACAKEIEKKRKKREKMIEVPSPLNCNNA